MTIFSDAMLAVIAAIVWQTFTTAIYVRAVLKNETKPHLFSWIIWGVVDCVAALAQYAGQAGEGAWPIAYLGLTNFLVAGLALRFGAKHVSVSDWIMLAAGLGAVPLWLYTSNPLNAVLLLTFISCTAYGPTVRKSYWKPQEENAFCFGMDALIGVFSLVALEEYSWTTALYPASITLGNLFVVGMLLFRRHIIKINENKANMAP